MNTRYFAKAAGLVSLLCAMAVAFASSAYAQLAEPKSESELLGVLKSDAPEGDKAMACKYLSIFGTSQSVPELAKLLSNEHLNSWARIPLEAIPGSAVDEALRKATESLQGLQLVGVINSIGARRDAGAVNLLAGRLQDKEPDVASAAAVALGKIGGHSAAEPLRKQLTSAPAGVRSSIAEGCILCAERFLAAGNAAEATKIYDEVRKADVPRQRMLEATRGAILARGKEGIPLLIEQLKSNDKGLYQIALGTARELPGREIDQALAAELEQAAFPERAALIVVAMADRPKTVDLAAVQKAAKQGPSQVRLAAIDALGRVGNATSVPALLEIGIESDAEIAKAAKASLAALPGDAVDKEIVSRLNAAQGKTYAVLIEVVGQRRIDAVPALLKALDNSDKAVRLAALTALGNTIPDKHLSVLITQAVSPKDSETASVAQTALKTAAVRMPDREACATELATAMNRAPAAAKPILLDILAAVGGTKALATLGTTAKSSDPTLQDVSTRLLGEWMTIDAAPVLLDLAKTSEKYGVRSLRGYIRITRQFDIPLPQRLTMCASALEAAKQPAEQKLVLDILKRYPTVESLRIVAKAAQSPNLKDDAAAAAREMSSKLGKSDEVRQLLGKVGADKVGADKAK